MKGDEKFDMVNNPPHYNVRTSLRNSVCCNDDGSGRESEKVESRWGKIRSIDGFEGGERREEQRTVGMSVRLRGEDGGGDRKSYKGTTQELRMPEVQAPGHSDIRERVRIRDGSQSSKIGSTYRACTGAHSCDGKDAWAPSVSKRRGAPQERVSSRQSAGEP